MTSSGWCSNFETANIHTAEQITFMNTTLNNENTDLPVVEYYREWLRLMHSDHRSAKQRTHHTLAHGLVQMDTMNNSRCNNYVFHQYNHCCQELNWEVILMFRVGFCGAICRNKFCPAACFPQIGRLSLLSFFFLSYVHACHSNQLQRRSDRNLLQKTLTDTDWYQCEM